MDKKYAFYSLCLLLLLTFLMAWGFGLTDTNFSVIGNRGGRRLLFLLWGAFTGNYFYLYTESLLDLIACEDRMTKGFLFCALMFFVTAVGIPYIPELLPRLSGLHVRISFLAPLFLGLSQIRLLYLLQKKTACKFRFQWLLLFILAAGSLLLLFSIGIVSSILEIYITCGMCLYLWLLHRKLKSNFASFCLYPTGTP